MNRQLANTRWDRIGAIALLLLVVCLAPAAAVAQTTVSDSEPDSEPVSGLDNDASLEFMMMLALADADAEAAADASRRLQAPGASQAEVTQPLEPYVMKKNFWRAAGEITLVNGLVWFYNRYIRSPEAGGEEGFKIGFQSWWENIKNGFEWDDNNFATNQFAHPYHGSLYYNAARSNGYNYWESIPFAFAGSYMWEYFGETHHPSINDWFSTSLGGVALGEGLYRFSDAILDNTATGGGRRWRELGALLVNPVRGFNRIFTGEWNKVHANPPGRVPGYFGTRLDFGLRTVGEERLDKSDTTRVFMDFEFDYGDPYEGDNKKPFDNFEFGLQLNFGDKSTMGRVQARGWLYGGEVASTEESTHLLAGYQHFDYINNNAYEYGAQSIGASYLSRFESEKGFKFDVRMHLNFTLMGASKSDYPSFTGRTYDYGPGAQFKIFATLGPRAMPYVYLSHEQYYVHAINGNNVNTNMSFTWLKLNLPLYSNVGAGVDYILFLRESNYEDFDDVSQRNPQTRLYLFFNL